MEVLIGLAVRMVGCVVGEWATLRGGLRVLARGSDTSWMAGSLPCLYPTSVLALRSKECNSITTWSCQCDPMGITPDIVVTTKRGDEKRGAEPMYQSPSHFDNRSWVRPFCTFCVRATI
jgi:hypothetical protein